MSNNSARVLAEKAATYTAREYVTARVNTELIE